VTATVSLVNLVKGSCAIALLASLAAPIACGGGDAPSPAERQLLVKANAVCAAGHKAMHRVHERFPENGTRNIFRQIAYAQAVVDVSGPTGDRLASLKAPDTIRAPYEEFVEEVKKVYYDDLTALHASHSYHVKEYAAARKRREREWRNSLALAAEIGIAECAHAGEA
jgi:hypothetical protein